MTVAAHVGIGDTGETGLQELFHESISLLGIKAVDYGGHSDTHAGVDNCGCGAIDKAPEIIQAVVDNGDQIRSAVALLGINPDDLEEIFANYASYNTAIINSNAEYSGKVTLEEVAQNNKVIKELDGSHKEVAIVLNTAHGKTVNQASVRETSGGEAQVFAVDVWRLQEISSRLYPDDESRQNKAFYSMIVHTLGVAATLTEGDLPVYLVENKLDLTGDEDQA